MIKNKIDECGSEKIECKLCSTVQAMIEDLSKKIEQTKAAEEDFPTLYAQFKNVDETLQITDIGLCVKRPLSRQPEDKGKIILELAVYKLPVPYKAGVYLFIGKKEEVLDYLRQPEAVEEILKYIPRLAENFNEIR